VQFYPDMASLSPGNDLQSTRTSIPGISEDDVVKKYITAGLRTAIETFADKLIEGFVGGSTSSVWRRVLSSAMKETGQEVALIVEKAVTQVVGSVRRRLKP